jgi:hypothetical protein
MTLNPISYYNYLWENLISSQFFFCEYINCTTLFLPLHLTKLQYSILEFYYSMDVVLVLMCGQFYAVMQEVISAPTFCTLLFYCLKLSMRKHAMNFATVSDIKLHLSVLFLYVVFTFIFLFPMRFNIFLHFLFVFTNHKTTQKQF